MYLADECTANEWNTQEPAKQKQQPSTVHANNIMIIMLQIFYVMKLQSLSSSPSTISSQCVIISCGSLFFFLALSAALLRIRRKKVHWFFFVCAVVATIMLMNSSFWFWNVNEFNRHKPLPLDTPMKIHFISIRLTGTQIQNKNRALKTELLRAMLIRHVCALAFRISFPNKNKAKKMESIKKVRSFDVQWWIKMLHQSMVLHSFRFTNVSRVILL